MTTGLSSGVPMPVVIFVAITIIAAFCSRYTMFGRRLYAIGGNPDCSRSTDDVSLTRTSFFG